MYINFSNENSKLNENLIENENNINNNLNKNIFEVENDVKFNENNFKIKKVLPIKLSKIKLIIFILLNIITIGLINILIRYFPKLEYYLLFTNTNLIDKKANYIAIFSNKNELKITSLIKEKLPEINNKFLNENQLKLLIKFKFKKIYYKYNFETDKFIPLLFKLTGIKEKIINSFENGLNENEINYQKKLFEKCNIEIKIPFYLKIIWEEITDFYYLFQIYALTIWFIEEFTFYAQFTFMCNFYDLYSNVNEKYEDLTRIKKFSDYKIPIKIHRRDKDNKKYILETSSENLLPGDIFELPQKNFEIPCDCILLKGNCIIDESFITGENLPIAKSELERNKIKYFKPNEEDKNSILFCGTKIIENNNNTLVLCYQTGFNTMKGKIVRSILFPQNFYSFLSLDSNKYTIFLLCICIISIIITYSSMLKIFGRQNKDNPEDAENVYKKLLITCLDLVTTAVPPTLHIYLGIGMEIALMRLKKFGIKCFDKNKINLIGKINVIVFDKTGTLTEDKFYIKKLIPINVVKDKNNNNEHVIVFNKVVNDCREIINENIDYYQNKIKYNLISNENEIKLMFVECLSCCNNLIKINDNNNKENNNIDNDINKENNDNINNISKENNDNNNENNNDNNENNNINNNYNINKENNNINNENNFNKENNDNNNNINNENNDNINNINKENNDNNNNLSKENNNINNEDNINNENNNNGNNINNENNNNNKNNDNENNINNENKDNNNNINNKNNNNYNKNKIIGDGIDVTLFKKFYCDLENEINISELNNEKFKIIYPYKKEPNFSLNYQQIIIKNYKYSSKLQRETVIIKNPKEKFYKLYTKGSPESIKEISKINSIPNNFTELLTKYSNQGFLILALGFRIINMNYEDIKEMSRTFAEKNIIFLGFVVIENKLKHGTLKTINELNENTNISIRMTTGDNLLTSLSVAKQCEIIQKDCLVYLCEIDKENNFNIKWKTLEEIDLDDEELDLINEENNNFSITKNNNNRFTILRPENISKDNKIRETIINTSKINSINFTRFYNFDNNNKSLLFKKNLINEEKTFLGNISVDIHNMNYNNITNNEITIAITGEVFDILYSLNEKYKLKKDIKYKRFHDTFRLILKYGILFAKMLPEHKTKLIESLQKEKYNVLMCGTGANNESALRTSNIGISIININKKSITAPFVSKNENISCLIKFLNEGKASLITSIEQFKYMILYSLIQFISVIILKFRYSDLSDWQYMMSDFVIIIPFTILMPLTKANKKLSKFFPADSIVSFPILISVISQGLTTLIFQIIAYFIMDFTFPFKYFRNEEKWKCNADITNYYFDKGNEKQVYNCIDNVVIFNVSFVQYFISAVVFCTGKPFKKNIFSNYYLIFFCLVCFLYCEYTIFFIDSWSYSHFNNVPFPDSKLNKNYIKLSESEFDLSKKKLFKGFEFKYVVMIITLVNFIVAFVIEKYFVSWCIKKWKKKKIFEKEKEINENRNVEYDLNLINDVKMFVYDEMIKNRNTINQMKEIEKINFDDVFEQFQK